MTQIADITVKKNDGVTDVVYVAQVPSAGDKSPAIFAPIAVGTAKAFRPELKIIASSNGPRTARRVTLQLSWPVTVTGTDGKTSVTDRALFTCEGVVPESMPDVDVAEYVAQATNLASSALVRDVFRARYAPT